MSQILEQQNNNFFQDIKSILQLARDNAYKSINFIMVEAYWNIGKKIVEVEQNGETKAKYGSKLIEEAKENTKNLQLTPKDIIKDPYVLEFLNLKDNKSFRENELECALLEKIQEFLLELGRGFAFVARQKRIKTQTSDFYIDLVFYNYLLKCFVLIDLKIGKLTHQDIGQIDMYVNMYDDLEKDGSDNPTIGIILCTDKDETVVKYSHINDRDNLFVSKYQMVLPTEEEFVREVEGGMFWRLG